MLVEDKTLTCGGCQHIANFHSGEVGSCLPPCRCPAFQPPSREPARVTDAEKTANYLSFLEAQFTILRRRIVALEEALEAERHEHHPSGKARAYFCWPARWYARSLKVAEPSAERSARLLAQEAPDAE